MMTTLFGLPVKEEYTPDGPQTYSAQFVDEKLKDLPLIPLSDTMRKAAREAAKLVPSFKASWLKALRSGDYQQADGFLSRKNEKGWGYCCLGVLCDLEEVPFQEKHEPGVVASKEYMFPDADGHDSRSSSAWLEGKYEYIISKEHQQALGELNDSGEWDFEKIATLIEVVF